MPFRRIEKVPGEAEREEIAAGLAARYATEMRERAVLPGGPECWRIFAISILAEKADRKRLASALLYAGRLPEPLIGTAFDLPDRWMAAAFTIAEGHLDHLRLHTPWDISTGRKGRPVKMKWRVAVRAELRALTSLVDQAAIHRALEAVRAQRASRRSAEQDDPPSLKQLQKIAREEIEIGLDADEFERERWFEAKRLRQVAPWLEVKRDIALRTARHILAQD